MKFNNRQNECIIKPEDGRELWISRSVAVTAQIHYRILNKDDHGEFFNDYLLLVKRHQATPCNPDQWCLPCGFLDWDETGGEAAIREVWEEAGLNLLQLKEENSIPFSSIFEETPWKVSTSPSIGGQSVILRYAGCFTGPKLPAISHENAEPNEIEEVKWFNIFDAQNMNLAFDHQDKIIEFVESHWPYGKLSNG